MPNIMTNKELIRNIQKIFARLIFYVQKDSEIEPSIENAFSCQGTVLEATRQMILRDFRLIEMLMDTIYYPFRFEHMKLNQCIGYDKDIFLLAYKCILLTIKEYRPNEIYAS